MSGITNNHQKGVGAERRKLFLYARPQHTRKRSIMISCKRKDFSSYKDLNINEATPHIAKFISASLANFTLR